MSKQWNPLNDLMLLQDRMNRLFEDASERRARVATETSDEIETADWYPAADVYDNELEYLIAVDLPGISRSELELDLNDDKLVIKGTRTLDAASSSAQRPQGRFLRTFTVPANVKQQEIEAEYKNGVLEVRLPKRKEAEAQRIQITVK